MAASWNTKWGSRRVRYDPPTLAEAIAAAQGLTDDFRGQVAIAAELIGAAPSDVEAEIRRLAPDKRASRLVEAPSRDRGTRTVVVERKASRRVLAKGLAKGLVARPLPRRGASSQY